MTPEEIQQTHDQMLEEATQKSNLKMFEFIFDAVLSEGGDGDITVALLCQDYKKVADRFYEFLGTKCDLAAWPWHRTERNECATFHHDQESFTFTNNRPTSTEGYSNLLVTCL